MVVVIPLITNNQVIYGVYSICISTAMFLGYADLGFVSAGTKFAAESYAKGEHKDELKLHGFTGFILFLFITLIVAFYLLFSYNPSLLIKDISSPEVLSIASKLLLIQAIFSYNTILHRFVSAVFQVRIDQYIYQRINIVASLIKIASVFYFFSPGKYDIVGYFLFHKAVTLSALLYSLWTISTRYKIPVLGYFKAFRFDKAVYNKTKGLAFSSLFATVMWILYYELDIIVIGKLLGASAVAIFALSFTSMKFLRSLSSVIFSPFDSRYNHFIGLNDNKGMIALLQRVVQFSMPIFVLIVISIVVLSKKLILSWAGIEYFDSWIILALLACNFMYSFIVIPGASMLTVKLKIKEMYKINFVMVLIFWTGVFTTKDYWGINSFAIFKLIAGTAAMLFYLKVLLEVMEINLPEFLKRTVLRLITPVIIQVLFLLAIVGYLPEVKSQINLLTVVAAGGVATLLGFVSLYLTSSYYKSQYKEYLSKILVRK